VVRPAHRTSSAASATSARPARFALIVLALVAPALTRAQAAPQIPLVTGLTIVSALHYPEGDRENVVTVADASSAGASYVWRFDHHGTTSGSNLPDKGEFRRFVRASDLAGAPRIDQIFMSKGPEESPGFTAFSFSRAVYQRLLTDKQTPFTVTGIEGAGLGASLGALGGVFQSRITMRGTLTLASPRPEPMSMLVNGQRVNVPVLHYTGNFAFQDEKATIDFWAVADSTHPLILKVLSGKDLLQTIRIDLPTKDANLERALTAECRAELPGIYFDFNSSSLDPASDPALAAVSQLLAKHSDWTIAIEGHTDNIGSAAANQTLSTQRAESVRSALTSRYHIAAARLRSAGFGATRPREPNTTIEGRARNRRVELVRPCAK
jgi:outer membrane protein OmpA-like peptidoglycan-associated protein